MDKPIIKRKTREHPVMMRVTNEAKNRIKINAIKEGISMIDFVEELSKQKLTKENNSMYNKTNKGSVSTINVTFISIIISLFLLVLINFQQITDIKSLQKTDACILEMYQAVPDVNDMEARSKFLSECIDN